MKVAIAEFVGVTPIGPACWCYFSKLPGNVCLKSDIELYVWVQSLYPYCEHVQHLAFRRNIVKCSQAWRLLSFLARKLRVTIVHMSWQAAHAKDILMDMSSCPSRPCANACKTRGGSFKLKGSDFRDFKSWCYLIVTWWWDLRLKSKIIEVCL